MGIRDRDGHHHRRVREVRRAGQPGQHSIWLTIACGIVGVLIGYGWLGDTNGIDWLAFFVSIVFAAILVMIAATVTGRSRSKV